MIDAEPSSFNTMLTSTQGLTPICLLILAGIVIWPLLFTVTVMISNKDKSNELLFIRV
jgi:hypothetical protein